jgi:hypothetical protein
MTVRDLRELLLLWREANKRLDLIESIHMSGGDAFDLECKLDERLGRVLELLKKES